MRIVEDRQGQRIGSLLEDEHRLRCLSPCDHGLVAVARCSSSSAPPSPWPALSSPLASPTCPATQRPPRTTVPYRTEATVCCHPLSIAHRRRQRHHRGHRRCLRHDAPPPPPRASLPLLHFLLLPIPNTDYLPEWLPTTLALICVMVVANTASSSAKAACLRKSSPERTRTKRRTAVVRGRRGGDYNDSDG